MNSHPLFHSSLAAPPPFFFSFSSRQLGDGHRPGAGRGRGEGGHRRSAGPEQEGGGASPFFLFFPFLSFFVRGEKKNPPLFLKKKKGCPKSNALLQVPLLAYGAYQEQLARYPWLLWADRAATFLESRSVASKGVLKSAEGGGCGGGPEGGSPSPAPSPLRLLLAAAASALAPLPRSLATGLDLLLDAATAARSLRAWAALGARGGDLSPYGLSTLPGGRGDCGPVTWTKRTANVLVMDTGAVKEVIRGNARVVVAAVERLGPGRRVGLRATPGAVAAVPSAPGAGAAPAAAAAAAPAAPALAGGEGEEEPRPPSSASPATAALLASVGGEVPGGEAPVLAPAPRFLEDVDAVILCTGFDTMQQAYGLIADPRVREALGGAGAAGYLVPPEQRGTGVVASGRAMPAGAGLLAGLWFVFGRLTQVRDGALEVAARIAEAERGRGQGRGQGRGARGAVSKQA